MKELLKRVTNTIITLSHISHIHELKRQWVMRGNNIKAKLWGKRDWMKNQDRKIDGWDKNGCVWVSYWKVVSKNIIRSFHVLLKQFLYSNMTREWKAELNVIRNVKNENETWRKNGCVWVSYWKVVSKNIIRSFHVLLKQFLYSNMTREWKAELNVIREPYCFVWWISGYLKMHTYCAHTAVVRFWSGIWLYMGSNGSIEIIKQTTSGFFKI